MNEVDSELEALIAKHAVSGHAVRSHPERAAIVRKVLERLAVAKVRMSMPKVQAICVEYAGDEGTWLGDTAWSRYLHKDFPELLKRVKL